MRASTYRAASEVLNAEVTIGATLSCESSYKAAIGDMLCMSVVGYMIVQAQAVCGSGRHSDVYLSAHGRHQAA